MYFSTIFSKKTLVFAVLLTIYAASLSSADVVATDCPNNCSGRGVCVNGKCQCNNGFFTDSCALTVEQANPTGWHAARYYICILYGLLFFGFGYILILSLRSGDATAEKDVSNGLFNARNVIIIFAMLICLLTLLNWAVDPNGGEGIYPYLLYRYIFGAVFPCFSTLFCTILFHWKSIYDISIATLRREEMLRSINKNYKSDVTLDDVLNATKIFKRSTLLYAIANVLAWVFQFIRETLLGLRVTSTKTAMQPIWMAFFGVLYFTESIGIVFYGFRLIRIMPPQIMRKMRTVTYKIMGIAIVFCLAWMVITIMLTRKTPTASVYTAVELVSRTSFASILISVLTLFLSFTSEFPFIRANLKQNASSSHGTTSDHDAKSGKSSAVAPDGGSDMAIEMKVEETAETA
jgi:hypothetical protein